jgi:hypothetical protein
MDLERKVQALRSGRPMREAAYKEAAAVSMRRQQAELARAAEGEEEDARRKRAEADAVAKQAADKVAEADEIAKRYWQVRAPAAGRSGAALLRPAGRLRRHEPGTRSLVLSMKFARATTY